MLSSAIAEREITGNRFALEDAFALSIMTKINSGLACSTDEKKWLRGKLQAKKIEGNNEYIPNPIKALSPLQRLSLERKL